mmetsp:Transcript_68645/g.147033  ORF Transcript_68645/g.147033 Transcript_68645/m.147033 type:complete len:282 (+) Transcript_68645:37-882(+)
MGHICSLGRCFHCLTLLVRRALNFSAATAASTEPDNGEAGGRCTQHDRHGRQAEGLMKSACNLRGDVDGAELFFHHRASNGRNLPHQVEDQSHARVVAILPPLLAPLLVPEGGIIRMMPALRQVRVLVLARREHPDDGVPVVAEIGSKKSTSVALHLGRCFSQRHLEAGEGVCEFVLELLGMCAGVPDDQESELAWPIGRVDCLRVHPNEFYCVANAWPATVAHDTCLRASAHLGQCHWVSCVRVVGEGRPTHSTEAFEEARYRGRWERPRPCKKEAGPEM